MKLRVDGFDEVTGTLIIAAAEDLEKLANAPAYGYSVPTFGVGDKPTTVLKRIASAAKHTADQQRKRMS